MEIDITACESAGAKSETLVQGRGPLAGWEFVYLRIPDSLTETLMQI